MRLDGTFTVARLNPGLLRHRITIQEKVVSGQDSHGQDIYTYRDVLTCYARKTALTGRELEAAMQRWSDARLKYEILYDSSITSTAMVVNDGGTRYDILDVQDTHGLQDRLVLTCKAVG